MNNNTHPCANKCSEFKNGGQYFYCLINETVNQGVYSMHRTEHQIDHIVEPNDMGDDTNIENHISPLCLSDSRKNESQSPLSIKQDALSRMESCYIEQKKHVELLQTEVTRLNSTVERLKAENVAMQVELDKSRNQAYKHLESCENSLNSQTERFDELSEKVFKVFEIINNPDNHYCPFGWVAEQIQAVLGEVQGEVA